MSAIVALIQREKIDNGIYYEMDIVELDTIMNDIKKLKININITDEEYFNELDYEEGEIQK